MIFTPSISFIYSHFHAFFLFNDIFGSSSHAVFDSYSNNKMYHKRITNVILFSFCEGKIFVPIAIPYNTVFHCVGSNPFLVNDKRRQQVVFCHFGFFEIPCQEYATTYVFQFGMERHGKRSEIRKIAVRLPTSSNGYSFNELIVYHKSVWLWLLWFTSFS